MVSAIPSTVMPKKSKQSKFTRTKKHNTKNKDNQAPVPTVNEEEQTTQQVGAAPAIKPKAGRPFKKKLPLGWHANPEMYAPKKFNIKKDPVENPESNKAGIPPTSVSHAPISEQQDDNGEESLTKRKKSRNAKRQDLNYKKKAENIPISHDRSLRSKYKPKQINEKIISHERKETENEKQQPMWNLAKTRAKTVPAKTNKHSTVSKATGNPKPCKPCGTERSARTSSDNSSSPMNISPDDSPHLSFTRPTATSTPIKQLMRTVGAEKINHMVYTSDEQSPNNSTNDSSGPVVHKSKRPKTYSSNPKDHPTLTSIGKTQRHNTDINGHHIHHDDGKNGGNKTTKGISQDENVPRAPLPPSHESVSTNINNSSEDDTLFREKIEIRIKRNGETEIKRIPLPSRIAAKPLIEQLPVNITKDERSEFPSPSFDSSSTPGSLPSDSANCESSNSSKSNDHSNFSKEQKRSDKSPQRIGLLPVSNLILPVRTPHIDDKHLPTLTTEKGVAHKSTPSPNIGLNEPLPKSLSSNQTTNSSMRSNHQTLFSNGHAREQQIHATYPYIPVRSDIDTTVSVISHAWQKRCNVLIKEILPGKETEEVRQIILPELTSYKMVLWQVTNNDQAFNDNIKAWKTVCDIGLGVFDCSTLYNNDAITDTALHACIMKAIHEFGEGVCMPDNAIWVHLEHAPEQMDHFLTNLVTTKGMRMGIVPLLFQYHFYILLIDVTRTTIVVFDPKCPSGNVNQLLDDCYSEQPGLTDHNDIGTTKRDFLLNTIDNISGQLSNISKDAKWKDIAAKRDYQFFRPEHIPPQLDETSCGVLCVAMVQTHLGLEITSDDNYFRLLKNVNKDTDNTFRKKMLSWLIGEWEVSD